MTVRFHQNKFYQTCARGCQSTSRSFCEGNGSLAVLRFQPHVVLLALEHAVHYRGEIVYEI